MSYVASTPKRAAWRHRIGWMVDLLGPAAFPITYFATGNLLLAIAVTTGAALLALVVRFVLDGRLAPFSVASGVVALATGGVALVFGSAAVLEMKPTLIHLVVGAGLLASWYLDGRPLKGVFGRFLALTDRAWAALSLRSGLFAIGLGILNEVIRRTQPVSVWALFHFPGQLILEVLFVALQIPLIRASRVGGDRATDAGRSDR